MRHADVGRPTLEPGEQRSDTAPTRATASTVSAAPSLAPRGEAGPRPACIRSAQLFSGALEVLIDHHGMVYRLKQTALGKLILTK
jgi:hemin uptake protein HemP